MSACRAACGLAGVLAAVPALADSGPGAGRLDVLAGEAAAVMTPWTPLTDGGGVGPGPWSLALVLLAAAAAAFGGTYLGLRRFSFYRLREQDGWREVTYRFRGKPVRVQADVLGRLPGLLDEIEELGARLRQPATTAAPEPCSAEREEGRDARYARARSLLHDGHDTATMCALTGLKTAEIDLLRFAATAATAGETRAEG